jgi:hypothetical protein
MGLKPNIVRVSLKKCSCNLKEWEILK